MLIGVDFKIYTIELDGKAAKLHVFFASLGSMHPTIGSALTGLFAEVAAVPFNVNTWKSKFSSSLSARLQGVFRLFEASKSSRTCSRGQRIYMSDFSIIFQND